MRTGAAFGRWVPVLIASFLMLLVGPAASAWGDAKVRFVHTIPGAGAAQLEATEGGITQEVGGSAGFAQIGRYAEVPAGNVSFDLQSGGKSLAKAQEELQNRAHYTVVAVSDGKPSLMVLRDGNGEGGSSRIRVVDTAPELGRVNVMLGDQSLAEEITFQDVSDYTTVAPGAYALQVTSPETGSPIASRGAVPLTAGTSSTAFVVGSAGEPVEVIVASDRVAAPRGAPATGLGGLAGEDSDLMLALIAGLLAALLGAAFYVALTARSRRGGL
jgi:Domain of unknown function (DUF4397)